MPSFICYKLYSRVLQWFLILSCNHHRAEGLCADKAPAKQRKFLVYESCLLALLSICSVCLRDTQVLLKLRRGSLVVLEAVCGKGHRREWTNQPMDGSLPHGNLQMAMGMLFSGCSPTKCLAFLRSLRVPSISMRTFNMIQKSYLVPAIREV